MRLNAHSKVWGKGKERGRKRGREKTDASISRGKYNVTHLLCSAVRMTFRNKKSVQKQILSFACLAFLFRLQLSHCLRPSLFNRFVRDEEMLQLPWPTVSHYKRWLSVSLFLRLRLRSISLSSCDKVNCLLCYCCKSASLSLLSLLCSLCSSCVSFFSLANSWERKELRVTGINWSKLKESRSSKRSERKWIKWKHMPSATTAVGEWPFFFLSLSLLTVYRVVIVTL